MNDTYTFFFKKNLKLKYQQWNQRKLWKLMQKWKYLSTCYSRGRIIGRLIDRIDAICILREW